MWPNVKVYLSEDANGIDDEELLKGIICQWLSSLFACIVSNFNWNLLSQEKKNSWTHDPQIKME